MQSEEIAETINNNSDLFPNNTQLSIALINGDKTIFIGVIRKDDKLEITSNEDGSIRFRLSFERGKNSKNIVYERKLRLEKHHRLTLWKVKMEMEWA